MKKGTLEPPATTGCCPRVDPQAWEGREWTWNAKPFIKGTVRSLLHIPLNMGSVITTLSKKIESAKASLGDDTIILSDEVSAWKSDQYISVSREVPGCDNVTLSGRYLTKVFEGPYQNAPKWHKEMADAVTAQGKQVKKMYSYYTTCPKCAKAYGNNYVVVFAQVE